MAIRADLDLGELAPSMLFNRITNHPVDPDA
jgi:hypothetical protein